MNKIIKASLSLFSVITLLTACSGENGANPINGSVTENEIPSEPKLFHASISEDIEDIKAASPVKSFVGINGETLAVDSAINVIEPNPETHSDYAYIYDYAYFTYNASLYKTGSLDSVKSITDMCIDSSESLEKYNEYLKNKSNVYTVKRGDKLKNGLICTDAQTTFYNSGEGGVTLLETEACFSGELTLTGTVCCLQEEEPMVIVGKGDILFIPDADNGNIPNRYEMNLPEKAEIDSDQHIYESFYLGNISDLSEEYASLIKDNEYTDVQVTLRDIHIRYANDGTIRSSSAVIADIKVI